MWSNFIPLLQLEEENEDTTDFGGHPQLKVVPTLIKT